MTYLERQKINTFLERRFKEESKKGPHANRVYWKYITLNTIYFNEEILCHLYSIQNSLVIDQPDKQPHIAVFHENL